MKIIFIGTLLTALVVSGCSSITSYVLIGETHSDVLWVFADDGLYDTDQYTKRHITKDTIVIGYYRENQPMESLFLFREDTCYYQETKIYCSPCAEIVLEAILKDRRFKFEHLGGVNYRSKKKKSIIMRIERDNENGTCSELKVIDTGSAR